MPRQAMFFSATHQAYLVELGVRRHLCGILEDGSHHAYTVAIPEPMCDLPDIQPPTEDFGDLVFLGCGQFCREHSSWEPSVGLMKTLEDLVPRRGMIDGHGYHT